MDLGPDPTDHDEIIQRYGRRLFVLAYHLTGEGAQAEELCQECLVRSLLAPDFPAAEKEAGVFLHRGLISLWRERAAQPGHAPALRAVGDIQAGAAGAPARPPRDHAALWRALSRLDPVSRAVLVLRVAEGLEYETIGKVLDMAPDVVYARLLQARGGLREGERALEASLFETMNLYLDGRLPNDQRGAFESRMRTDAALRERVEFHRGLTLELHEEAPALPRDFIGRLRERLERTSETLALVDQATQAAGWDTGPGPGGSRRAAAPEGRRLSLWAAGTGGALVLLFAGVVLGLWAARPRAAPAPAPLPAPGQSGISANPGATPDEATIEALRSLGYLAPGKERSKGRTGKETQAQTRRPKPAATPGAGAAKPVAAPAVSPSAVSGASASPAATPPAAVPPAPVEAATPDATPTPPPSEAAPQETGIDWRVVPVARAPESGRDHQVIRTAQEWAGLFEGTGGPAPEVAFDREMVVLLRGDLSRDPPARLVVSAVKRSSEAILIECREKQPGPDTGPTTSGQAVVVPISDLTIRVIVR